MSTAIQTETPTRGRPRKFDEGAVLDALTELFWEKGYEATSMADILDVSGLRKSSLYNTFGSKRDLFRRILDRYIAVRMEGFAEMAAANDEPGIQTLHDFLARVFAFGRAGCLAVNTTTELGASDQMISDLAHTYRDRIRTALQSVIATAIGDERLETRTEMLLGFLLGYAVAARTGASDSEMAGLTTAAHTTVAAWAG